MAYATRSDIENLWGASIFEDILSDDSDIDETITTALDYASDEIDAHLSARYEVPFKQVPDVLKGPCVAIAVYMMANRHASLSQTMIDRYDNAVLLLKRIADGKGGLGAQEPHISSDQGVSTTGAAFTANPRYFTRGL